MPVLKKQKRTLTRMEEWLRVNQVTYRELAAAMGFKHHEPVYLIARGFSVTAEDKKSILAGLRSLGHKAVKENDLW